jgi:AbrB family looped-hinge helix DNA binding protein
MYHVDMADSVTMDSAGRVILPAAVRRELALAAGTTLNLEVVDGAIVLRAAEGAHLVRRAGRLVVRSALVGPAPDHRDLREERLQRDARLESREPGADPPGPPRRR